MRPEDPQRTKHNIGRRIAELRRERGLTQDNLAQALDIGVKYVQRMERGVPNMTVETLVKVANVLRVRSIDLLRQAKVRVVKPGRPVVSPGPRPARKRR